MTVRCKIFRLFISHAELVRIELKVSDADMVGDDVPGNGTSAIFDTPGLFGVVE